MNEIVQSFISSMVSSLTGEVTSFLEKKVKNWKDIYFNSNIADYLNSMNKKFSITKTFLHRNNTEDFRKRYFNVLLKNNDVDEFSVTNIDDFFKNNSFISIISPAGTGKTMFVKNIFLKTLEQKNKKIPIEINLREINSEESCFEKYINDKLKIDLEVLNMFLEKGMFLFLFDGYDEISIQNKKIVSCQIESFVDKFHKNYFLITSRPGAGLESIPRFKEFTIKELNILQIKNFIKIQIDDKDFQDKIISIIDDNSKNHTILEYLKNPLLLSMFLFTFESYPEIPKSRSQFYWNVYDTLCNKHDSISKFGGYQHERKSNLKNEEITTVLEWFAYKSFFENKYSFNEQYFKEKLIEIRNKLKLNVDVDSLKYDLVVSISIIIEDGLEYRFPHKTMQEYFVARLIKNLDEKSKDKIYSKIILEKSILFDNISFLDLCKELDNLYFKKIFLMKNLLVFLSKIELKGSDLNKCKSFLNCIQDFRLLYQIKEPNKDEVKQVGYGISFYVPNTIEGTVISNISYFTNNKKDFFYIPNKISKIKLFNMLEKIGVKVSNENKFSIYYTKKIINSSVFEELLEFTGLKDRIIELINFVITEVETIDKEIKEQEEITCDLIDL